VFCSKYSKTLRFLSKKLKKRNLKVIWNCFQVRFLCFHFFKTLKHPLVDGFMTRSERIIPLLEINVDVGILVFVFFLKNVRAKYSHSEIALKEI